MAGHGGNTLIAMWEPRYKKAKNVPSHGNWTPGDWGRTDVVWGADGCQAMWETKTRGCGARVARYRKNLIANKIQFVECLHTAGKIPGFSRQSPVIEFIFIKKEV